ncbi:MAG: hypothetical protein CBD16_03880 [Betaproteobacteria bacterium TMED156]|nr:MAG: hypothetical protein CBD16_03880 [Betaproteobacteria bacterium TMED156]
MKTKNILLMLFTIFYCTSAFAQVKKYGTKKLSGFKEEFFCVMDQSTGFKFNNDSKVWELKIFKANESKFILQIDKKGNGLFYRFGNNSVVKKKFNSECINSKERGFVVCQGLLGEVHFSRQSRLISHTFIYGYSVNNKRIWNNMSLTPSVSIGKCSLLEFNKND